MITNISFVNNNIYYYDIKKNESTEEYNILVYRGPISIEQSPFPILKNFIIAKKEIKAELFITKLDKIFKLKLIYVKSFEQLSKQLIGLMNSCMYTTSNLKYPLILSVAHLNGKSLPKIEKICLIDNNMYFVTKYKKEYIMHAINDRNIECVIPISSIIVLYKKLKIAINTKKKIKNKHKIRGKFNDFFDHTQYAFHPEELITSTEVTELQAPRRNQRESRQPDTLTDINTQTSVRRQYVENNNLLFEPEVLQLAVEPLVNNLD